MNDTLTLILDFLKSLGFWQWIGVIMLVRGITRFRFFSADNNSKTEVKVKGWGQKP